jgi:predicted PurR-regulated permease PerM
MTVDPTPIDHPTASPPQGVAADASGLSAPAPPASELRFVIGALSAALCIAALHFGKELFVPLVLAALLAFVMAPAVTRLRRWRVPHIAAVALVVSGALALSLALAMVMGQQLRVLGQDLPRYQETVRDKLRALRPSSQEGALHDGMRLLGMVEGELDAARRALTTTPKPAAAVQRVQFEPTPETPLQAIGGLAATVLLPLAQAGFVLVLVFFMLMQRYEIRDRVLRLMGSDMGRSGDALEDAARRVSRYLLAQILVNVSYAVPLALGLWWIGVPGAWLWGLLGGVLRFVPYLGPAVSALCPLALAFAVDPGWGMVVQTLALVLVLELVSNNVIEPFAYSRNTGVSSMAVLVSAGFWSLLWGPVGLAIATPLTVLLVVLGRHLGPLRILDQLLGSDPVFDAPTRLMQRLLSGDVEEALELAQEANTPAGLANFFDAACLGALLLMLAPLGATASAAHRHRMVSGMARLLQALREDGPDLVPSGPRVLCIGARNEFDTLSAEMLAHALRADGVQARALPASVLTADRIGALSLDGVAAVCVCSFNAAPLTHTRFVLRRLRRRQPELPVLLAAWDREVDLHNLPTCDAFGGLIVATSIREALARLQALPLLSQQPVPANDASTPDAESDWSARLTRYAQQALDVFGVDRVTLLRRDSEGAMQYASAGLASRGALEPDDLMGAGWGLLPALADGRAHSIPDIERDATFGPEHPMVQDGMRFYAGAPLQDDKHEVVGVLALHSAQPRHLEPQELRLLEQMAAEVHQQLKRVAV